MSQQVVLAGQGQNYKWSKDHIFVKTARELTDGRITVVEDTLQPGFHLARHYHKVMTEIFYILEGEVIFNFDDETVRATPGTTLNVPPNTWHDVRSDQRGKLITIFNPGGFDAYLQELSTMSAEQFAEEPFMNALAEKYDTWTW